MQIAITGANSSVGKVLLRHIADGGDLEARAGVRRPEAFATLPTASSITPCVIRYDDPDSLAALVDGADCLVHLAGILIESQRSTYETANVESTRAVVDACRRAGVGHIVLVSAIGADANAANRYYRSKGVAEQLVADSGIASTIIRTPILLGPGTAGAESLVGLASRTAVKVLGGGHHTLRPLDVDDLSVAILSCCRKRTDGVATHDLVGPEAVTQRALLEKTGRLLGHDVSVGGVPVWVARLGAVVAGWIRSGGMTPTVIDVITADETVEVNADVDLGITLTPLAVTLEKLIPGKASQ